MAINYGSLKQAENNLLKKFYAYLSHTYKMHLVVIKTFEEYANIEEVNKKIQRVFELEKISNITQAELLDECTWMISKEQPQAGHLRFVIAIINSINDLERICDYANNLAKFLEKTPSMKPDHLTSLATLERLAIDNFYKIFEHFRTHDAFNSYEYAEELLNDFTKKFREHLEVFNDSFFRENQHDNGVAVSLILAFKNVERIMDHIMNVIEYFIYIKEAHFFFKKRS